MTKRFLSYGLPVGAAVLIGIGIGYAVAAQPHMEAAIEALKTARSELESAVADKGGHRVKAIGLVDEAIKQVREGMAAAGG
jgi:prefoldin subunit 5